MNEAALRQRLAEDYPSYSRTCLRIRPKAGGVVPLALNAPQRFVHDKLQTQKGLTGKVRALILKARQWGCSTYVEGRFYHQVTHRYGVKAFILTHHSDATENLFTMTERFHAQCPDPFKPATGAANAKELQFDVLGSAFEVGTAGTEGVGRSDTIQYLHGSEVAFWKNADNHVEGLLQTVPNTKGTEIILESTANGPGGVFYNMCMAAMRGEGEFILIFVPWFMHDEYSEDPPSDWRPPGEFMDYRQMHEISEAQLFWAWKKNAEMSLPTGGSTDSICSKFRQEYPATAHEAFQTTSEDVLIKPEVVMRARKAKGAILDQWPIILGVDVARGGGDMTRIVDRQGRVLGFNRNEVINSRDLMEVVGRIGKAIRETKADHCFVDVTGLGAGVYDRLIELGYSNVTAVNFGSKAEDFDRYANKRAEMGARLAKWCLEDVSVPDEDIVTEHFCAAQYKYDSNSRLLLEAKEKIKERLGFSPDFFDAAGLTFAEHVEPRDSTVYNGEMAETYDEPDL